MLDSLHTAIVDRLAADIPGLGTCAAYPKIERKVALPAVLVELDELEPDDFGEGPFDCWARFTVYCIYDPVATDAELQVRNLAATVAVRVSQEEEFGAAEVVKAAEVLHVGPDGFKPELDGYLVWAVEFQIGISIGEAVWAANPADGVSVITVGVDDLDNVSASHVLADGNEPPADDSVDLPDQPKG